jgi:hypothetical protein
MRRSVERFGAERCTADPGPSWKTELVTIPGLQRTVALRFTLRCARDTALHQHRDRLLDKSAEGGDELGAERAVDDAVIAGERY